MPRSQLPAYLTAPRNADQTAWLALSALLTTARDT